MLAVVCLHGSLEVGEVVVNLLIYRHVDLCAGSPEHDDARAVVGGLEVADVLAQSLYHVPSGLAVLHVVAV